MNFDEVLSLIEEGFDEGFRPGDMTLYVDTPTHHDIYDKTGFRRWSRAKITDIDRILGVDVVSATQTELSKETECQNCGSDKVHHDTRNRWLCPFCEI